MAKCCELQVDVVEESPPATPVAHTNQEPDFVPESPPPAGKSSPSSIVSSLDVVRLGVDFTYTIPSFSAISVSLRQVLFEGVDELNRLVKYDVFIRDDPSLLNHPIPFSIIVTKSCEVPVST